MHKHPNPYHPSNQEGYQPDPPPKPYQPDPPAELKDKDHDWIDPPPGTFSQGKVCSKCGYRSIHKAARIRCGHYEEKDMPVRPAIHDFDPYEG